ncbi:MAG: alcohol dehydrogenase catalytic domain-containing protein, partial [Nitrospinota bacterium]
MRAIVFDKTISFRKEERVPEPENDEALVRIICAGICNTDIEIIHGYMGFTGIPGHEFTGIVEKCKNRDLIGRRVTGEINIG